MSEINEINKIVANMKPPDFTGFIEAVNQFGEAAAKAGALFQARLEELAANIIRAADELPPETYHAMGMKHPREALRDHYLYEASPAEVVQYILQQPNYTWMGVTIYPDEAWRYEYKSDWMWWRQ